MGSIKLNSINQNKKGKRMVIKPTSKTPFLLAFEILFNRYKTPLIKLKITQVSIHEIKKTPLKKARKKSM